ncbi:MAG: hypothetical protein HW421_2975 [Ignavibacteria bacterium]|nr:hypothetical protein [Ignavibacteria bacterium]
MKKIFFLTILIGIFTWSYPSNGQGLKLVKYTLSDGGTFQDTNGDTLKISSSISQTAIEKVGLQNGSTALKLYQGFWNPWPIITNVEENNHVTTGQLNFFPNPFASEANITYSISSSGFVEIRVYTISGDKIAVILSEFQQPGEKNLTWRCPDGLANGTYICWMRFLPTGQSRESGEIIQKAIITKIK